MNTRILQRSGLALTAALTLATGRAWGQTAPAPTPPPDAEMAEETIMLSPFVVDASEDADSYQAKATLAGSRIRTELKDVGSAISVVTAEFLRDTGATNNETLLQYTTNTEVSGIYGNFAGVGNNRNLDDTQQRLAPHQATRVRGLGQADNTRDFFLTDIPWDSYNVGRVDLQRGPNAILFGMGKPAGIINTSVNGATFRQGGQVEVRVDNHSSLRGSLDWNQVLQDDELAVRFTALDDHTKYQQKPAYNRDQRYFGALRWDPKFLSSESAHTTINVKYESGKIRANRPRLLPPGDLITPWWTDPALIAIRQAGGLNPLTTGLGLGQSTALAAARAAGDLGAGVRGSDTRYSNATLGSLGRNYGGIVAVFADPTSSAHTLMTTDLSKNVTTTVALPWTTMMGVIVRRELEGVLKNKPNYDFYRDDVLQDRSFFDFYNQLLDGPNKREWSNHDASNLSLAQTFFDNKVGFEAVADHQNYDRGQVNLLSEYGQAITIDLNNHLVDGRVNPNYGKAVAVSDQFANNNYDSRRSSQRLTAFADLKVSDFMGENKVAKFLGRHVITGLAAQEDFRNETRSWFRYAADQGYGVQILAGDVLLRDRGINTMNYLSSTSLAGLSTLSGAKIGNIKVVQIPYSQTMPVFDMAWTAASSVLATAPFDVDGDGTLEFTDTDPDNDPETPAVRVYEGTQVQNPANYRGWNNGTGQTPTARGIDLISDEAGDRNALTTNASLRRTKTKSYAANWQAYLADGILVPSIGIRQDEQESYALGQGPKTLDGTDTIDLTSPNYRLPTTPDNIVKGNTTSWSVVLHTPQSLRDRLPGNTGLSLFYNRSENFEPAAGRLDVYGNSLTSPVGKTEDFGFMINTLDDRVTFKVNFYDTVVKDAALDNFGGSYMIWGAEAWAYAFGRGNLDRVKVGGWGDFTTGYLPVGDTPEGGWSTAQLAQARAEGDAIVNAYMANLLPASWYSLWGIDTAAADAGNFIAGTTPPGFTVTGDTHSKGVEFELAAQPAKNWNIAINASKTSAERTNMAQSLIDWTEARWEVYNQRVTLAGVDVGRIGDLRFWNGTFSDAETLRGKFLREYMSGYYLYRIQENSDVPELRPWRFNAITNYSFSEGRLNGVNVGGGLRWQDGVVIGFPVLPGATLDDPRAFDLDHPYTGPAETNVDLWVGYRRRISDKLNWHMQVNVRNAFGSNDLIPVTVQPDGTMAGARIPEARTWTLTNTFSF